MKEAWIGQLQSTREFFTRSTKSLTEDDSNFAPADGTYTAANPVAHAAQTIDWFVDGAFAPEGFDMNFEEHDREVRAVQSMGDAQAWFGRAVDNLTELINEKSVEEWSQPLPEGPIMGGMPRYAILWGISDHTAHHRGALTVYSRLCGKIPPNPYMEG